MKYKIFYFLLIFQILNSKAQQVINIESRQYDNPDSLYHGNIEFMFNLLQNKNQVVTIGNKFDLSHTNGLNTWLILNEFNFVRANAQNLDYNAYQHVRIKRQLKPWLNGEAFAQTQFNQQIGLRFRGLLGAGPRIRLLYTDSMKVFVGPMWMYEYEETTAENERNIKNRLSLYLSFLYFKEKNFNFDIVCYYQPDLVNFNDFRLMSEVKASWTITRKLGFRFSLSQNYTSVTPPGFPNNMLSIRNSFLYHF